MDDEARQNQRLRAENLEVRGVLRELYEYTVDVERAFAPWVVARSLWVGYPRAQEGRDALGARVREVLGDETGNVPAVDEHARRNQVRAALLPYTVWRHTKGARYTVLATAGHTETGEHLVVYVDGFGKVWARPLTMFLQRFTPADAAPEEPND